MNISIRIALPSSSKRLLVTSDLTPSAVRPCFLKSNRGENMFERGFSHHAKYYSKFIKCPTWSVTTRPCLAIYVLASNGVVSSVVFLWSRCVWVRWCVWLRWFVSIRSWLCNIVSWHWFNENSIPNCTFHYLLFANTTSINFAAGNPCVWVALLFIYSIWTTCAKSFVWVPNHIAMGSSEVCIFHDNDDAIPGREMRIHVRNTSTCSPFIWI